jgi:hypothetical protein
LVQELLAKEDDYDKKENWVKSKATITTNAHHPPLSTDGEARFQSPLDGITRQTVRDANSVQFLHE